MTIHDLDTELRTIGIPVSYREFSEPTTPPFLVYLFSDSQDLMADNINYQKISDFAIELYTRDKDPSIESLVESKLRDLELPWHKYELWIQSEKVYQILYDITIVE